MFLAKFLGIDLRRLPKQNETNLVWATLYLTLIYAAVGLYDTHSLNGFFSFSSYVQK